MTSSDGDGDTLPEIDPDLIISPTGSGEYEIETGDSMASIADSTGHFWQTIWNDAANADLKKTRENPETLFPGDKVTIPALRQTQEARPTDLIHTFKRKGVPIQITYRAATQDDEPFPDKDYVLRVGKRRYEGKTDQDGALEHWISPAAKTGQLSITLDEPGYPKSLDVTLNIGALPPANKLFGIQARLNNLGYSAGAVDGVFGVQTFNAIKRFQAAIGLDPDGVPNGDVIAALEDAHGS